jgi:hypothetical protein
VEENADDGRTRKERLVESKEYRRRKQRKMERKRRKGRWR